MKETRFLPLLGPTLLFDGCTEPPDRRRERLRPRRHARRHRSVGSVAALGGLVILALLYVQPRPATAAIRGPHPSILGVEAAVSLSSHARLGLLVGLPELHLTTSPFAETPVSLFGGFSYTDAGSADGLLNVIPMMAGAELWVFVVEWLQLYGSGTARFQIMDRGDVGYTGFAPQLGVGGRLWPVPCDDDGALSLENLFCVGIGVELRMLAPLSDYWATGGLLVPGRGTFVTAASLTLQVGM